MASSRRPGFYGKFPIQGDYVTRRLPRQFIDHWHEWLQSGLSASRERLGDDWLEIYLTSPIWRFVLSAGLCGPEPWAGIVMPSVDRVGRYFPLTLAAPLSGPAEVASIFEYAEAWFERLESLALSSLEDGWDLEEFDTALRSLESPALMEAWRDPVQPWPDDSGKFALCIDLEGVAEMPSALSGLSGLLLRRCFPTYSLWATRGSERVGASLLACEGLPPPKGFTALMAGRGQQEDWDIRLHDSAGLPFAPEPAQSQTETRVLNPWANLSEASPLPLSWHSHGLSDKGKRRSINEDAFLERSDIGLWAVADGMGGHYAGDKASQCVIAALAEIGDSDGLDSLLDQVRVRIQEANRKLRDLALATTEGGIIGSTVVVFLAQWDGCAVAWAGDSRLYRFRDGKLTQLTQDHALMVEGNQSQLMGGGNIVTRAVGAEADIELEIFRFLALKGDMYLLCSDGLPKELGVEEIAAHLRSGSCVDGACGLIAAGLEKEGRDNITVILACPEMQPVSET